ncbi:MAG: hypothetical protein WC485_11465 [Opitutaceae bacterium]
MSCSAIVRGNTVIFTATFYDQTGAVITPLAALTRLVYEVAGTPTTDMLPMVNDDGTWTAAWDSSVADVGTVYWHTQSTGSPAAAEDGSFAISANVSNPQT